MRLRITTPLAIVVDEDAVGSIQLRTRRFQLSLELGHAGRVPHGCAAADRRMRGLVQEADQQQRLAVAR